MASPRPFAIATCTLILVACGGSNGNGPDAGGDGGSMPQCSDNVDNDGDGKIDFPNDPGGSAPNEDNEQDDCPSGPNCPQCSNGKDDDTNGMTDYPNDPGCTSAGDNDEFTHNANACGAGMTVKQLPV